MLSNSHHTTVGNENCDNLLRGKRGWIVTNGMAGHVIQCEGIMEALGLDIEYKTVTPSIPWRYLSPWGPTPPNTHIGATTGQFAGPLPEIIIGSSRQAVPYIRALTKYGNRNTLTVFLQNPGTGVKSADLIWISDHDRNKLSGDNIISTLLAPHRITEQRLNCARKSGKIDMSAMTRPCIAVSVGGKNSVYSFNSEVRASFARHLSKAAQSGVSFLVTPSRRTDARVIEVIGEAIKHAPHQIWDGSGENPYFDYLALCDGLIVTADSINMTGEAIATGKPVYVFHPGAGSKKFNHFHEKLRKKGITRNFEGVIETWDYEPLDATMEIAREIATRWHRQQATTR